MLRSLRWWELSIASSFGEVQRPQHRHLHHWQLVQSSLSSACWPAGLPHFQHSEGKVLWEGACSCLFLAWSDSPVWPQPFPQMDFSLSLTIDLIITDYICNRRAASSQNPLRLGGSPWQCPALKCWDYVDVGKKCLAFPPGRNQHLPDTGLGWRGRVILYNII